MLRTNQGSLPEIERLFSDFQTQYQQQNYGAACNAFLQAVNTDPSIGFRYFIARASGAVGSCARMTSRTPQIVEWLDGMLSNYPDMHIPVDYDSEMIRRIVD